MELTDRQHEIAMAIRQATKVPDNDSWGDCIDFIRALAIIVEGAETLVMPAEMSKLFGAAWDAVAKMWATEHIGILVECLGSKAEYERIRDHPNGRMAFGQILKRVQDTYEMSVGMSGKVEVADILYECRCMVRDTKTSDFDNLESFGDDDSFGFDEDYE